MSRIRKSIAAIDTPKSFFEPTNNRPVLSCLAPGDARWNPSKPRSHPAHSTRRKPQKPRLRTKWHKILNRGLSIGGGTPPRVIIWYFNGTPQLDSLEVYQCRFALQYMHDVCEYVCYMIRYTHTQSLDLNPGDKADVWQCHLPWQVGPCIRMRMELVSRSQESRLTILCCGYRQLFTWGCGCKHKRSESEKSRIKREKKGIWSRDSWRSTNWAMKNLPLSHPHYTRLVWVSKYSLITG